MQNRKQTSLRRVLGHMQPHDHLCLIYQSREEQLAAAIAFICTGLLNRQRSLYIADESTVSDILGEIRKTGIDAEKALADGSLSMLTKRDAYLRDGRFDPDRMLAFLRETADKAVAEGYSALRVTGEMSWALGGEPGTERLIEYEAKLNLVLPEIPCLAICQYDRTRFTPETIRDVSHTHPLVIYGQTVARNCHFIPPQDFLGKRSADHEVDRMLSGIVERHRAEEDLRTSEATLRNVVNVANESILLIDPDGIVQVANETVAARLGTTVERLVGTCAYDWLPKDCAQARRERVMEAIRTVQPVQFEDERLGRWIESSIYPVLDAQGHVGRLAIYGHDVTERRQAEEALRQSEDQFRTLAALAPVGIYLCDVAGKCLYANPRWCEMAGMTLDEALGDGWMNGLHPDDRASVSLAWAKMGESKGQWDLEYRFRTREGKVTWVHGLAAARLDGTGKIVGYVGINSDITERKTAEAILRQKESLLNSSQRLARVGGWEWDVERQAMYWTDETYRIHGMSPGAVNPGAPEHIAASLACYDPADRPRVEAIFLRCLQEGVSYDLEFPFTTVQGRRLWVRTTAEALSNSGRVVKVVGTLMDITDRRCAEERLLLAHDRLTLAEQAAGAGLWDWDMETEKLVWSPELFRLFGLDPGLDTASFDTWRGILHPDDREPAADCIRAAMQNRTRLENEYRIVLPSGQTRWISAWGNTTFDGGGRPLRMSGICIDITDRKKAEEALRESEKLLSQAQEIAHIGSWVLDLTTERLVWSDEVYRIFGCEPQDFKATYEAFLDAVYPDDRAVVDEAYRRSQGDGSGGYEIEHRIVRRNSGEIRYVHARCVHERDGAGGVIRSIGMVQDVTERRRGEDALREMAERLRLANKATRDVIWDWDVVQDTQRWNDAGAAVFGWTEIVDRPVNAHWWAERVYRDDRERVLGSFLTVVNNPQLVAWQDEYRFLKADGTYADVLDRGYVLRDAQGRAIRMIGAMQDITERKRAEETLRDSEQRYRALVQNIRMGVTLIDPDRRILAINEHHCQMYARTEEQLLGQFCYRVFEKRDQVCPHCPGTRAMATGLPAEAEAKGILDDGSEILVRVQAFPVVDPDGRATRFIEVVEDITERRQTEEKLRETQAILRAAMDNSQAGIAIADAPDGRLRYVNDAGLMIRGGTRDSVVNGIGIDQYVATWKLLRLDGTPLATDEVPLAYAIRHGKPCSRELVVRRSEREDRVVWANAAPILDEKGQVKAGIVIFVDITDRKLAEEEKQRLQAQLLQAQKMEAIGRLAAGIAHDINNQLTVVRGYSDLLLARRRPDDPLWAPLSEIRAASQRAHSTTSHLLSFSRRQVLNPEPTDLNLLLREIRGPAGKMIGEDVRLVLAEGEGIPPVLVDRSGMHQAIMNLIVNSRDAMPEGGELLLRTSRHQVGPDEAGRNSGAISGPCVLLEVKDTGTGMDQQTLDRIFDPFFTTKEVGKGTGLGLPMVEGFIRQSGGFVDVKSSPGHGTVFSIFLPVASGTSTSSPKTPEATMPSAARANGTVLVVEDDDCVRKLVVLALRQVGYSVHEAADADDALRHTKQLIEPLDLLITDVVMPSMNGADLAKRIQTLYPSMRTLFITGYMNDDIRKDVRNYLSKPFSIDDMIRRVQETLKRDPD